jgi:PPM family protein phosphatase
MPIRVHADTNSGHVRHSNEDRICVDLSLGLFLVCDGMGGHQHGEIAAELTASAIRQYVEATRDRLDVSWPFGYNFELSVDANRLVTAIQLANSQVWRRAEQSIECAGMGSTIAAALLTPERAILANVGDSRVYLFRDSSLCQLSLDDTIVATMFRKNMLSASDAAKHPLRNMLTQAAGAKTPLEVHIIDQQFEPDDVLLLCSDGLYTVVPDAEIQAALRSRGGLSDCVAFLINAARAAGGPDNISVVLIEQFA